MRGLLGKSQRRTALERAEHRDQGHRHRQRDRDGNGHGQRLVAEQLPGDAVHEHQRQEHRDGGQRGSHHRQAHFAGAGDGRIENAQAALACLGDAFQHHDGIVHHQAGGQREPAQRHHVQAQTKLAHEKERGDDRHRQRQAHHEGAPAIAQEQEDDQDRQRAADHRILLDIADGVLDEAGLVLDGGDVHVGGQQVLLLELLQPLAQRRRRGHGVGVAFLVDGQLHRFLAAQADDCLALLVALGHPGHVPQPYRHAAGGHHAAAAGGVLHRRGRGQRFGRTGGCGDRHHLLHRRGGGTVAAGLRGDQQVADFLHAGELVDRAHQEALRALFQPAAGQVDVLLLEAVDHGLHRQVQLGQLLLVQVHLHLVLEAAADLDRSHAVHRFELLLQVLVGIAADLAELAQRIAVIARGVLRRQHQPHDRLGGRIEAQQHRRLGFLRQLQRLHLVAHVEAGLVHVGVPGKLQHHITLAGARNRAQLAQVLDHADGLFHRLADQGLDFRRRRTGVFGAHGQGRVAQVGQQVDLEVAQRDQAEQHQRHRHHRHGDAAAGGEADDAAVAHRRHPRTGRRRIGSGAAHPRFSVALPAAVPAAGALPAPIT